MNLECQYRQALDKALHNDARDARTWARLWPHVGECSTCRDYFNRFVAAERAMHGGVAHLLVPSDEELGRVAELTIARAAPGGSLARAWARLRQVCTLPTYAAVGAALAAAGAATVLVIALRTPGTPENNGFSARGVDDVNFVVRTLCIVSSSGPSSDLSLGNGSVVTPAQDVEPHVVLCPPGGTVAFVYKAAAAGHLYAYQALQGTWTPDTQATETGYRLPATWEYAPLPVGFSAEATPKGDPQARRLDFVFILTSRPLDANELQRARQDPSAVAAGMEPRGWAVLRTVRFGAAGTH